MRETHEYRNSDGPPQILIAGQITPLIMSDATAKSTTRLQGNTSQRLKKGNAGITLPCSAMA